VNIFSGPRFGTGLQRYLRVTDICQPGFSEKQNHFVCIPGFQHGGKFVQASTKKFHNFQADFQTSKHDCELVCFMEAAAGTKSSAPVNKNPPGLHLSSG